MVLFLGSGFVGAFIFAALRIASGKTFQWSMLVPSPRPAIGMILPCVALASLFITERPFSDELISATVIAASMCAFVVGHSVRLGSDMLEERREQRWRAFLLEDGKILRGLIMNATSMEDLLRRAREYLDNDKKRWKALADADEEDRRRYHDADA